MWMLKLTMKNDPITDAKTIPEGGYSDEGSQLLYTIIVICMVNMNPTF